MIEGVKEIEKILHTHRPRAVSLRKDEVPLIRVVSLAPDKRFAYNFEIRDEPQNSQCGFIRYYQLASVSDNLRLMAEILHNYLKDEFFNQLRTQEQLGYVVRA